MTIRKIQAEHLAPHRLANPVHHYRCMAKSGEFSSKPLALVTALSLIALLLASTGALSPSASLGNPPNPNPADRDIANVPELVALNSPLGAAIGVNVTADLEASGPSLEGVDPTLARRFLSSRLHRLDRYELRARADHRLVLEGLKEFSKSDFLLAGVQFKRASKTNPQNVTARLGLALSLSKLGYNDRAFDQLLVALRISPKDPVTLYYGSEVMRNFGRNDKAKALIARALKAAPEVREWLKADLEDKASPNSIMTASLAR